MSLTILNAKAPVDLIRTVRRRTTPPPQQHESEISKAATSSNNSKLPAYINIEGVGAIFLEPATCAPELRSDFYDKQNATEISLFTESVLASVERLESLISATKKVCTRNSQSTIFRLRSPLSRSPTSSRAPKHITKSQMMCFCG